MAGGLRSRLACWCVIGIGLVLEARSFFIGGALAGHIGIEGRRHEFIETLLIGVVFL